MPAMGLARVWRRQLYGVSTAALIVPTAMLAALLALALGGAFSGVGVLGQVFAGPSLAGVGSTGGAGSVGARGGAGVVTTASLPLVPVAPVGARSVAARGAPAGRTVLTATRHGVGAGGGAIAPVGGTVRPVTSVGSAAPVRNPFAPAPPAPAPAAPSTSQPPPPPRTTPVDMVVTVVTSVTQQVPAPAGPVATQVVQAAGSAAGNLLPVSGQSVSVP
jgi:hypothetical protein